MSKQKPHHGPAVGSEPREATGLDVRPAPPEHEAHGVEQPPPPQQGQLTPKSKAAAPLLPLAAMKLPLDLKKKKSPAV